MVGVFLKTQVTPGEGPNKWGLANEEIKDVDFGINN